MIQTHTVIQNQFKFDDRNYAYATIKVQMKREGEELISALLNWSIKKSKGNEREIHNCLIDKVKSNMIDNFTATQIE